MLGSVIVPAHNEATVIGASLRSALDGLTADDVEVVVACNGCTDGTANVVTGLGLAARPRVLDLPEPSKIGALRAAEDIAASFPRVFLDADVELTATALRDVLAELSRPGVFAARPPLQYVTDGCSWPVRSFYRARSRVPALTTALWGAGIYGLSAAGRDRVGRWPDVMGDDLHADRAFERAEIVIVATDPVRVRVPRTTGALLRVLTRVYQGKWETPAAAPAETSPAAPAFVQDTETPPETAGNTAWRSGGGLLSSTLRRPWTVPDLVIYVGFAVVARVLAKRGGSRATAWERDDTTR